MYLVLFLLIVLQYVIFKGKTQENVKTTFLLVIAPPLLPLILLINITTSNIDSQLFSTNKNYVGMNSSFLQSCV